MRLLNRRSLLRIGPTALCILSWHSAAQSAPRDEIEEAKKIAIDEVLKREKWKTMRAKVGRGWREKSGAVTVWRLPETPGGLQYLTIRKGNVVEYQLGR